MMGKKSCDEGPMTTVICPSFEINLIEALKLVHNLPLKLFDFARGCSVRERKQMYRESFPAFIPLGGFRSTFQSRRKAPHLPQTQRKENANHTTNFTTTATQRFTREFPPDRESLFNMNYGCMATMARYLSVPS